MKKSAHSFASQVVCALGGLASSVNATVTIIVRTSVAGALTNSASVSSQTTDPNAANNSAVATTTVTPESPPPPPAPNCHPSYPDVCIPPPPPDLDCGDIPHRNFRVIYTVPDPDPHRFDGDRDGIGCET